jgi:chromosomal replication initiator protein
MTLSPYAAPGIPAQKNLSMKIIENAVSKSFNLPAKRVHSKSRKAELVLCRQITMLLGKQLLKLSYKRLGEFYDTDHATAMHAVQKAQNVLDTEPEVAEKVEQVKARVLFG